MTVYLTNARDHIKDSLHIILDAFLTEQDFMQGIFLKPNIVFPVRQDSNEIVSPQFVGMLIEVLREKVPDIDIVIGEGVAAGLNPWENFQVSGYVDLAHELKVPLIDLNESERTTLEWKFGKLKLPTLAFERTYINLPILKRSSACTISGALKNQKGLLLPADKKKFHRLGLHEQIAELNAVVKPALTIMDCSNFFGRNVLVSGKNCGEIDAAVCQILGIEEPEHVKLARDAGVFSSVSEVTGDEIKRKTSLPVPKEFKRIGRLRLWSNSQACTMCRNIFQDMKIHMLNRHNIALGMKLLRYSITGAELIMGSNPQWQREYDTVICIGACTRRIAKEGGYIFIPGCPPTTKDFNEHLSKRRN
jgi:uncharacterized protein (DUF362 family)